MAKSLIITTATFILGYVLVGFLSSSDSTSGIGISIIFLASVVAGSVSFITSNLKN